MKECQIVGSFSFFPPVLIEGSFSWSNVEKWQDVIYMGSYSLCKWLQWKKESSFLLCACMYSSYSSHNTYGWILGFWQRIRYWGKSTREMNERNSMRLRCWCSRSITDLSLKIKQRNSNALHVEGSTKMKKGPSFPPSAPFLWGGSSKGGKGIVDLNEYCEVGHCGCAGHLLWLNFTGAEAALLD